MKPGSFVPVGGGAKSYKVKLWGGFLITDTLKLLSLELYSALQNHSWQDRYFIVSRRTVDYLHNLVHHLPLHQDSIRQDSTRINQTSLFFYIKNSIDQNTPSTNQANSYLEQFALNNPPFYHNKIKSTPTSNFDKFSQQPASPMCSTAKTVKCDQPDCNQQSNIKKYPPLNKGEYHE
jgi:hypothetical protein